MSRSNLAWLLGFTAVALVALSLSHTLSLSISAPPQLLKKHENYRLLVDVLEEVQQKYVKELDAEKMRELVENMISGGLFMLDPHSDFVNAEEFRQFNQQNKGTFGGVGISIEPDRASGLFKVVSPMPGTPAYEAGVQAGDYILKVDGVATENLPMKKIIDMIQGEPGTRVTITVQHEGDKKPVDLEITRAKINVESVMGDRRMKNNLKEWDFWIDATTKIAYVRVTGFTETTVADLTKVVAALQRANMRGLVIDLRTNPGGLLRAAVEASSLFLPEGKHVVTTKGRNQKEEVYNAHNNGAVEPGSYPIAVLINRFSASASEILAAALQDHLRAVIIGERSYGKGSVQNVIMLENNNTALRLTTASYWRPSGQNIHRFPESKETEEWGVKPSKGYEVKLTDDDFRKYLKWRRSRDVVHRAGGDTKEAEEFRDKVLDKALEYIRGEVSKQANPGQVLGGQATPPRGAAAPLPAAPHRGANRLDDHRLGDAFDADVARRFVPLAA